MDINLDKLSLKELKNLRTRVTQAIESFKDRKKIEARAELEERARELGFKLNELLGTAPTRKPGVARYANPADRSQTWSGRGRKPGWVVAALKAGKKLEDLAI
ncbi:MAG: transcriptional regulator [Alphaproteobacteria bacterium HGW-Alphaproteobacteria-6]|nr:MAG: transcriptional regulator [Alphaproteobacteria bacterium HGW-Alphaproteobacteria-6]